jgi:isopenicillin N synthase-like dioxygenase
MLTAPFAVPLIDLAAERESIARDLRAASCSTGVFFVSNHGVPSSLIAEHFTIARAFFDLSLDEKRAIDVSRSNAFRGYEPFGTQTIDEAAPGDLKEGFIMGPDFAPDHAHALARFPNTGTNLWPARPAGFREHMDAYVDAMRVLGRRLAGLLALSLNLPEAYFAAILREPLIYSQLFHYPSVSADLPAQRLGAGAHLDWGMLTILLQDDVGGLEVRAHDTSWHAAAPVPGTFVVILGEMMLRFTDGFYRSAMHRVRRNTSGRGRYSMPTFFDPDYDECIACVPTCLPANGALRYPARTVAEHMREMATQTLTAT